jgi:hypothetical protein
VDIQLPYVQVVPAGAHSHVSVVDRKYPNNYFIHEMSLGQVFFYFHILSVYIRKCSFISLIFFFYFRGGC